MKISLVKYYVLLLAIFAFTGCATRPGRVITMNSYLEVHNGETRDQILRQFGEPFAIELKDDGMEILTYIERFTMDGKVVQARYYYFYIKGDKVVGKIVNTVDRPLSIDSDDL